MVAIWCFRRAKELYVYFTMLILHMFGERGLTNQQQWYSVCVLDLVLLVVPYSDFARKTIFDDVSCFVRATWHCVSSNEVWNTAHTDENLTKHDHEAFRLDSQNQDVSRGKITGQMSTRFGINRDILLKMNSDCSLQCVLNRLDVG
jgi:hypothetical protein